jgi:hypothetical protein
MDERRVALLVDGENLSVDAAGFLITTAGKAGVLCVKRVFGAVTRLGGWNARVSGLLCICDLVHAS